MIECFETIFMRFQSIFRLFSTIDRKMNYIFTQKYNPMNGRNEWQKELEDYDFFQALARSAFGDMVNDRHRNQLYLKAIEKSVNRLKAQKKEVLVLDIGTGTGLLSMMAVQSGADRAVGCDCFEPIAKCAQSIVQINGLSDQIKVINKRSNELTVGSVGCDLNRRADLLVAELFDTELIGEGAIGTYRHAVENLLTTDALLVPSRGRVYCQLVESESLYTYHQLRDEIKISDKIAIESPESVRSCRGSDVLHDIQINELKPNKDFVLVTEPEVVFEFEFNNVSTLTPKDRKVIEFKAIRDISGPLVVFMWWALDMDFEGEIVLTCAPFWTYKDSAITSKQIPWRDHWMQSIYYFSAYNKRFELKANQVLKVEANRDEYSLWFNQIGDQKADPSALNCNCGHHLFLSRTRISMLNDICRLKRYNKAFEDILQNQLKTGSTNAIFIGDSSVLPIIAAKYKEIEKMFCLVKSKHSEDFIKSYSESNGCEDKIKIIENFDQIGDKSVGLVFGEPFFNASDLPWNHFHFWYLLDSIPKNILTEDVVILPKKALVKAIPIEFDNLWKIHSEVGADVEGFDLSDYDKHIQNAMSLIDSSIESQPLWEYPGKALTERPFELFFCDFRQTIEKQNVLKSYVKFNISSHLKQLNTKYISIAFWVEFYLTNDLVENSGPIEPTVSGEYVHWSRHYRQGVCFLPNIDVLDNERLLSFTTTFDIKEGIIDCQLN